MSGVLNRLAELGTVLAERMPSVLTATTTLLESICEVDIGAEREDPAASGELHALIRRFLGWSPARVGEVDQGVGVVREMAAGRVALVLRGDGALAGVARRLHQVTVPGRPFVVLGRGNGEAIQSAADGTIFVEGRHLPRDLGRLADARARLVVGAARDERGRRGRLAKLGRLTARLPRIATVWIPPLRERTDEIERLLEAYGRDAIAELDAPDLGFRSGDLEWARANPSWIATLAAIEDVARRLVAIRTWGVTDGAKRLGISHAALSRWASRRGIPTIGGAS